MCFISKRRRWVDSKQLSACRPSNLYGLPITFSRENPNWGDKMRRTLVAAFLLLILISPAISKQATVDQRRSISLSISNCLRDQWVECAAFKTTSVSIGATVTAQDYFALADWKSSGGKRRGQVFLSTKGCGVWDVDLVSSGRQLTAHEIISYPGLKLSSTRSNQLAFDLTTELARIDSQTVSYLRVPPGPTC